MKLKSVEGGYWWNSFMETFWLLTWSIEWKIHCRPFSLVYFNFQLSLFCYWPLHLHTYIMCSINTHLQHFSISFIHHLSYPYMLIPSWHGIPKVCYYFPIKCQLLSINPCVRYNALCVWELLLSALHKLQSGFYW